MNVSDEPAIDAEKFVIQLLHRSGVAMSATEIKQALQAAGLSKGDVDRVWPGIRRKIRTRPDMYAEGGHRYRVAGPPGDSAPVPAKTVIPLLRALAELAIEVEELATNRASARAIIHRVRARVKLVGLEPIDRAGERSTLDRTRHASIGPPILDGTPVLVLRPGYLWKADVGDVLLERAVVQERG